MIHNPLQRALFTDEPRACRAVVVSDSPRRKKPRHNPFVSSLFGDWFATPLREITPEEIQAMCAQFRADCPQPADGPRDGKHVGTILAMSLIRDAGYAIREWQRRWNQPHERYKTWLRLFEKALLAWEWLENDPAICCEGESGMESGALASFADCCASLGVDEGEMRSQVLSGLDLGAMAWLGALAGIAQASQPSPA